MDITTVTELISRLHIDYGDRERVFIKNMGGDPILDIVIPENLDNFIGTIYNIDILSPNYLDIYSSNSSYYLHNRPIVILAKNTGKYDFSIPQAYEELAPYTGRPFIHGKWDCFTLLKDYYARELNVQLPPVEYFDNWWKKGEDFYMKLSGVAGFYPVTSLKKYDVIAMRLNSPVFNHSAIFLGDNTILHHIGGKFSCIESIRPAYIKSFYGFFRHKDL